MGPENLDKWFELEQIIAAVPFGMVLLDRDLRYLRVNHAIADMLRMKADDMLGKTVAELFPDHIDIVRPRMMQVLESGEPQYSVERGMKFEEGQLSLLSSYLPIRDKSGAIVSLCIVAFETTDLVKAEMAIRKARDAAEAASQAKDKFLAVLSHELRTPLTPVLAMVSNLQGRNDLPTDVREDLATIRRNVELESRLIDDLLDLTRISQGKVNLRQSPTDMHVLLHHAINICGEDVAAKRLDLRVDLSATQTRLIGDPARLQQVCWNLLKNAVKFTPENGRVWVRSSSAKGTLRIEFQDNGIGIEASHLPRLFKAFEQGQLSITRQFGGLGLGLAISKALLDLHGGTISAQSPGRGQGATFIVTLPVEITPHAPSTTAPSPAGLYEAPPARILLVEDHPDTLRVMARLIRATGHTVETATNVADAVAKASAGRFDLLISDIGLPDGTGLDIMSQIKPLPAVALSGYGMPEDVEKSKAAGFAMHLIKPVNVDELMRAIASLLTRAD
jgi:two-component system CheB/CheR fusion protein